MRRIADLVLENEKQLAELEVRDNGKLYAEMLGAVRYKAEYWYYYAGLADKVHGAVVPSTSRTCSGSLCESRSASYWRSRHGIRR